MYEKARSKLYDSGITIVIPRSACPATSGRPGLSRPEGGSLRWLKRRAP